MAKQPLCAPFAVEPITINRQAGETDEDFLKAVQERAYNEVREGLDNTDATNAKRVFQQFKYMTGMEMPAVLEYAQATAEGYRRSNLKGDKPLAQSALTRIVAATEIYFEKRSQGIKQMAQNYVVKRNEGEAIVQAKAFLDQLLAFNRLAQFIAKGKLEAGSQLRQFRVAKGLPEQELSTMGFAEGMNTMGRTSVPDQGMAQGLIDNIGKEMDAFQQIKEMINRGEVDEALQLAEKVAKQIGEIDDPRDIAAISSRWKSTWNSWDEVWMNGLLSSPETAVVNVTGLAWVAMRPMMQLGFAKAMTESGIASGKFKGPMEQAAAEAGAMLAAQQQSFMDALVLGWRAAKSEKSLLQETTQRITAKNLRANNKYFSRVPASAEIDQAIDLIGGLVRMPSRFMLGVDEMGKILGLRSEVAANGILRAINDGVKPSDQKRLNAYVAQEMKYAFDINAGNMEARYRFNPETPDLAGERAKSYNLMNQASTGRDVMTRAREYTFQEPNRVAKSINSFVESPVSSFSGGEPNFIDGALKFVLKPYVPFVTTPLNIIKQGVYESTPFKPIGEALMVADKVTKQEGVISPLKTYYALQQKLLEDPGTSARIGGQISLMTVLGGVVWGMTQDGTMTGGGPAAFESGYQAYKAQRIWEKYNVPYSIKIGDNRIAIDRLGEPFATMLRSIANAGMYSGYMTREEQDSVFGGWAGMAVGGLYDASFLRGFDNFMKLLKGGTENWQYEAGKGAQNWIATQMPFGSLLGFVDRAQNPYRSAYEGAEIGEMMKIYEIELGRGLFGKFLAKIPGVQENPLITDQITGGHIPIRPGTGPYGPNPLQQAIPFFPRNDPSDKVWEAVMEIMGSYSDANPLNALKPLGTEKQRFNELMSEERIDGLLFREWILRFRVRPDVDEFVRKGGVTARGTAIQREFIRMKGKYSQAAKNSLLQENPNLLERFRYSEQITEAQGRNDLDAIDGYVDRIDELRQRALRGY